MVKSYDSKCFDLAKAFLEDEGRDGKISDELIRELALEIQQTIEDFLEFREDDIREEVERHGQFGVGA